MLVNKISKIGRQPPIYRHRATTYLFFKINIWGNHLPLFLILPLEKEHIGAGIIIQVMCLPLFRCVLGQQLAVVHGHEVLGLEGLRGRDAPALGHAELVFLKDKRIIVMYTRRRTRSRSPWPGRPWWP